MKRVLNLMKEGVKWYFNKCAEAYYMTPTGIIPMKV